CGTRSVTTYRQDFPFAGSVRREELRRTTDGRLMEETTYEYEERVRGATREPLLVSRRRVVYGAMASTATPDLVEASRYEYDAFGNRMLEAQGVTGAPSRPLFVHHVYGDVDVGAWHLGLERECKHAADDRGAEALVHRRFEYDRSANRLLDEVWDTAHARWL